MIQGALHIQQTSGGNFLQPGKQTRDIVAFNFADEDPLEVIRMLESVLTTVKQQVERSEESKKSNPADKGVEKSKLVLRGGRRRTDEADFEEEEDEDELPREHPRNAPRV